MWFKLAKDKKSKYNSNKKIAPVFLFSRMIVAITAVIVLQNIF